VTSDELKQNEFVLLLARHLSLFLSRFRRLRYFRDLVAFDATGANPHTHVAALRALHANFLQVGVETSAGAIVRVGDVITELRAFAADFASFCHDCLSTSV
jgi:hypothetical protein